MPGLFDYDGVKRNAGYGVPFSTKKDACLAIIMLLDLWLEYGPDYIGIVIKKSSMSEELFQHYDWSDVYEWLAKLYCERTGKFPPAAE
jgi:hypothetical protein